MTTNLIGIGDDELLIMHKALGLFISSEMQKAKSKTPDEVLLADKMQQEVRNLLHKEEND